MNPTQVKGVGAVTGKTTINIAGCPPHPNWEVWAIAQLLLGNAFYRDSSGRPTYIFREDIHEDCPREEQRLATSFADPSGCLMGLGCRGPGTHANCASLKWNNGQNWCIGTNAPCYGCTEPNFPGTSSFYQRPPPGVLVAEVGTWVLDGLHLYEWADKVLALDALQVGGAPGTIYACRDADVADPAIKVSMHELSLLGALRFISARKRPEVYVLGVEPDH